MSRLWCLILPALLLVAAEHPQAAASVSGTVYDDDDRPISQVNIQSAALEKVARTDDQGEFRLLLSGEAPFTLIFSHAGYIPRTIRAGNDPTPLKITLDRQVYPMQGITVTAGRAQRGKNPVAATALEQAAIERDYDIGEVPALLETTPNLYSYSDAGGGLGYSYLKVRGFDARRTPVYINGVPLNDPEDHALYFVDLPDFAGHSSSLQVQRGIGNALYGDAAFGGSVNIRIHPCWRIGNHHRLGRSNRLGR